MACRCWWRRSTSASASAARWCARCRCTWCSSPQSPSWWCSPTSCWRCRSGCCPRAWAASRAPPARATSVRSSIADPIVVAMAADLVLPVAPLTPRLGALLRGVRLADDVGDKLFAAIHDAFLRHQVLLFESQPLPPAAQVAFARRFGEVQVHVMNQYHADGHPELYRLSNLDEHGRPSGRHPDRGTLAWHTDGSWSRVTGQATIIYGEVVPASGGETHFCDMYGAYDRLSSVWKARIAGPPA